MIDARRWTVRFLGARNRLARCVSVGGIEEHTGRLPTNRPCADWEDLCYAHRGLTPVHLEALEWHHLGSLGTQTETIELSADDPTFGERVADAYERAFEFASPRGAVVTLSRTVARSMSDREVGHRMNVTAREIRRLLREAREIVAENLAAAQAREGRCQ